MERRTAIATAGGANLGLAAVVAALAVNAGAISSKASADGPGTFEPAAEQSTTSAPVTTLPEVTTVYVDENGNIVDPPGAEAPRGTVAPSPSQGSSTATAPSVPAAAVVPDAGSQRYAAENDSESGGYDDEYDDEYDDGYDDEHDDEHDDDESHEYEGHDDDD